ncbi:MAG TPA: KUP/HAK/KT family potassium transporter [Candidatus Baltobacteraceae bacterium]|nr:KUP/HAK/KT family potassium transporter [Candidatus Baltobacteraceae bacterium]
MATETVAAAEQPVRQRRRRAAEPLSALSLAALGVVFGDIGTSPLYAFSQCFTGEFPAAATRGNILGICSLILWTLVVVVCVKYVACMMRADYDGEGGILALLAQLMPAKRTAMPAGLGALALIVLFGASMLYGDGAITPAISVISALEGLDVWTTAAHRFIVPLAVIILIGLFAAQSRGTAKIGALFGPVMLIWFAAIAIAGGFSIAHHPQILAALSPTYAASFIVHNGIRSLLIFGAVVLCVTGAEALYADLAHFGRRAITYAWYVAVFPALVLNYFGQGAIALGDPKIVQGAPFFSLVPHQLVVPMVLLATVATVIASQALISGVFSLTYQAMQLGYCPRFRLVHTSRHYAGQIFMPTVNAMLGIICIVLVITFKSSSALGGAYGLAVTITMLATTIAYSQLLRKRWHRPAWQWVPLIALFLCWDIPFLIGNASKFISGGWVPFALAVWLFTLFTTWNRGRRRLMESLNEHTMPVEQFLKEAKEPTVVSGTAFFLSPEPRGIPFVMQHEWLRNHIVFDTIVLLTIMHSSRPFVHPDERVQFEDITPRLLRVKAWYGYMEEPQIRDILHHMRKQRPAMDFSHPTYYLADPKIRRDHSERALWKWQRALFRWMARNARPLTDSLGLPPNRVVEFGVEVRI